ncbi:MAG: hypothetical protein A2W91_01845 [Bacteroidetes bacterium GWF2_38_335]|nr:MAG: hypothetical protein A2W91_01845 [Bacteroidetes bacterium GWF2_38_335]OFY78810.1 MAG: hypothetical protein A2281_19420 [Bacteroidetes bacterium RIFOXYA12_FULL_38_20]HBS85207.1 hypothetical protein [Bacteroidales bacterium]
MRKKTLIFIIVMIGISLTGNTQSVRRQSISSCGTTNTSSTETFEQTVGQPYNTTAFYCTESSVLQGFQQPVIFSAEKVNSEKTESLNLCFYPNPATYVITIQSEFIVKSPIITVNDINGKLIQTEKMVEFQKCEIYCDSWVDGTYILTVVDENGLNTSRKIIIKK